MKHKASPCSQNFILKNLVVILELKKKKNCGGNSKLSQLRVIMIVLYQMMDYTAFSFKLMSRFQSLHIICFLKPQVYM